METATHYATLGVTQSAEVSVIRAAYKALVLNHHPDKTVHLSAEARAEHSAIFRGVQEAWDVLGNPSLKALYDHELERHGNRVDLRRSTFHRSSTPHTPRRRHTIIRLTTPEEKRALKAKAEQDLAYLRERRVKRDMEDSQMDTAGLRFMLQTWTDMCAEYDDDVDGHGYLRAYCAVQMQVYQDKIARREHEHEEWLEAMSQPKTPGTPGPKSARPSTLRPDAGNAAKPRTTATAVPAPRTTPPSKPTAFAPHTSPSRTEEKACKHAARQAHLDAKAAAVRAEKEKQKARVEDQARQESDRITRVRAKADAAPLSQHGTGSARTPLTNADEGIGGAKRGAKKVCGKCHVEHASFSEWRRCAKESSEVMDEESFFRTV